ncbi:11-oxo-beta-amyrin 30-oxidase [Bienertia sinuspersici]
MNHLLVTLIIPIISVVVYNLVRASNKLWWRPKCLEKKLRQQGIRGTSYSFLTGDMKEWVKQVEDAWSKSSSLNHQIVSMCWAGPTPRLIIKDVEMMKQVLSNKQGHFEKPYLGPQLLALTKGLTTLEGEKWAKHRKIINPGISHREAKVHEKWKSMAGVDGSCEVDIWPEFQNLTADVISRTAFGSNFEEGKHIFELQKELVKLVIDAMQTLNIPESEKKGVSQDDHIDAQRRDSEKRERCEKRGSKTDDLLGLLLQSNQQNSEAENSTGLKNGGLTIEEVIEESKQFYLAGQETTASLLNWTVIILAIHQDWQEKAREEVVRVCGRNLIDFEATTNLKTAIPSCDCSIPTQLQGNQSWRHHYSGWVDVTLPTLLIHHDPEIWGEDVDEFKPERFSEGLSKGSKDQLAFFPFGFGPRTCVGQNFALVEAKVALSMILQNFSIQLSPSYSHAPHTVMMLQPQYGAHIILRPQHIN